MSEGSALNSVLTSLPMSGAFATGSTIDVAGDNQIVLRVSYKPNTQASGPAFVVDMQWSNDRTRWSSCIVGQDAAFVAGQDSLDSIVHRMFRFGVDPTESIDQALLPFDCSKWAYCRVRAKEVGDAAKPGAVTVQFESSEIHQVDGLIQPFERVSRMSGVAGGPVSSTDNALMRWSGSGGNTSQDSSWILSDSGSMDSSGGRLRDTGAAEVSGSTPTTTPVGLLWLDTAASPASGTAVRTTETITASATLTQSQDVLLVDASSGAVTLTLPAAADRSGKQYDIKKIDSSGNAVTIDGNGSETIDDSTTLVINSQYTSRTIVSDGTEWWIL